MLQAVSHEYTTRDIDAMVQKKHGVCVCVCMRMMHLCVSVCVSMYVCVCKCVRVCVYLYQSFLALLSSLPSYTIP